VVERGNNMSLQGYAASFSLGSNEVGSLASISNSVSGETLDVTTFDSGRFREFISGLVGGSIDVSGFYDPTDTTGQVALLAALLAGTKLTSTQKPEFLIDGTNGFTADAYVSTFSSDAAVAGVVNFSATLQLTGTIAVV